MNKFVFFNELDNKEPRFDDAYECFNDEKVDFYIVKSKDEYYVIYANGEQKKLPPICHGLCFENGFAEITVDGKHGLVDLDGNIVIEPKYVNMLSLQDGLIAVTLDWESNTRFINLQGNEVIPPLFRCARPFYEGLAAAMTDTETGYRWGYIDKTGEFVIKPKYSYASEFFDGIAEAQIGNRSAFINKQGNEIRYLSKRRPEFKCGRMSFCKDRCHGFINENNEIVIPAQYTMVKDFYEGLAGVKRKGEKWGFIDTNGNTVIEPQFDDVAYFSEGLCAVRIGKLWGYIDIMGDVVIKPRFEEAGGFSTLCATAGENSKVGIIDKNGNYLIEPIFDIIRPFDYEGCRIVKIGEKYDIIKVEICGVNVSQLKVLSDEERKCLLINSRMGDIQAREELIKGNLRLVLLITQKFANGNGNMDDIFQVGCIGLNKAIDNFNIEWDIAFSTYAVPMIIGEIRRYLRDNNSIKKDIVK